jgi:hypothetical protein
MDCLIEIIDWILRITGILAIVFGFVSLLINQYEFDVNVYINRINKSDLKDYKNALKYIDINMDGEYLVFMPKENVNFKNVNYREYMCTGKKFEIKKVLKNFKNINCTNGLIIDTYYPCGAPSRVLEWEADYGIKGRYIITEDGKDGNVIHGNFFYKYNLISKFRKIIGWK